MNMAFGLYQEQSLKLVMTPELRQAITILQYSAIDLVSYLQEQAIENPMIELKETAASSELLHRDKERAQPEIDWKELVGNRATGEYSAVKNESTFNPIDIAHSTSSTLYDHLVTQLSYVKRLTATQKKIAMYLIGNLDERGYLEVTVEEVSERLGVSTEEVEDVLSVVHHLEPAGVAARNLEECLLLQLQHDGLDDEKTVQVVTNHLNDLANNRFSRIADALGITIPELQDIADVVRKLNPRPGAMYNHGDTRYVIPDVTIEKVAGDYVVLVNDSATPRLTINSFYERLLKEKKGQEDAQQFINEKLNAAIWLAKSLEQRRQTLYKVTQAILDVQKDFFEHGIHYLKPMTQKEIAEKVELHESTVSRATSNKYVQTPRGVFELKYFFTSALSTANGDAASSESVKRRIKSIIDSEDRKRPYSDQKLAELLVEEGIEISRRTVAKYREEMMIPSSAKRKRY